MSDEEYIGEWYAYEGGATIGEPGQEGGTTLRDEEFGDPEDEEEAHARLTLERSDGDEPEFILTATLYGWMFSSRREPNEAVAHNDYDAMLGELERLSAMLPYEEDGPAEIERKSRELAAAIAAFEARFSFSAR